MISEPNSVNAIRTSVEPDLGLDLFYYSFLFYVIMVVFVLPHNLQISHAKISIPLFAAFLGLVLLKMRRKIPVIYLSIIFSLLMAAFLVAQYEAVTDAIVVSTLMLFALVAGHVRINRKALRIFCWVVFFSLIYQLYQNMDAPGYWQYTSTLNVGDTNFSGLYMLLFFYLCYKSRFLPGEILAFASVFIFLSRSYFLAFSTFWILRILKERLRGGLKRLNFFIIFVVFNALFLLYGNYIFQQVSAPDFGSRGIGRLLIFYDRSAFSRIRYNYLTFQNFLRNSRLAIFGMGQGFGEFSVNLFGKVPHNTLIHMIGRTGLLFALPYIGALTVLFRRLGWYDTLEYIVPIIIYSLFLHGVLDMGFVALLTLILVI